MISEKNKNLTEEQGDHEFIVPRIDELVELVKNERFVAYDVGMSDEILGLIEPYFQFKNYDPNNYPDQSNVPNHVSNHIMNKLMPTDERFLAIHGIINRYFAGQSFSVHADFPSRSTYEECQPAEVLTFLYVVMGEKEIDFYFDGLSEDPTIIKQKPGTLYVFQGGSFKFESGEEIEAVPHAVRPQDTNSITYTWELGIK